MTTTTQRPFLLTGGLPVSDVLLPDGSLWSHAATYGEYVYRGESLSITPEKVDNFIRVFTTGYPQKAPVDYDHASTTLAGRQAGPVPKAGDILQLANVRTPADLTAPMLAEIAKAGREADDPRNLGLWIRWKPTARALQLLAGGEYTEMSITFLEDHPHNQTGEPQGPTIIAVALTNTPFLDGMVPIALTRRADPSGAGTAPGIPADARIPGPAHQRTPMNKMLAIISSLSGRAVTTEDEAAEAAKGALEQRDETIRTLTRERDTHRDGFRALTAEIGETDPAKALEKVKALKEEAAAAKQASEAEKAKALTTQVDAILKAHEDRITPAQRPFFAKTLRADLAAGAKAGETETEQTLAALPPHGITGRRALADTGANPDREQQLDARVKELQRDEKMDYATALSRAEREMATARTA